MENLPLLHASITSWRSIKCCTLAFGIRTPWFPVNPRTLIRRRVAYAGSLIGGIAETQEMLDFCAEHGVLADIEVVGAHQLDEAYDRMVAGDVKYRFVLDAGTLQSPAKEADE